MMRGDSCNKPKNYNFVFFFILLAMLCVPAVIAEPLPDKGYTHSGMADDDGVKYYPDGTVQGQMLQLPLSFIENRGQAPDEVKFHVSAAGHTIAFAPDWIILRTSQGEDEIAQSAEVTMTFPGASGSLEIVGLDRQPGNANFFIGNNPSLWQNDVPVFSSIEYRQLYSGIDLRYRGTEGILKREFAVAPGADPERIAIAYNGIEGLALNQDGSLAITTALGILTDQAPVAYQEIDGIYIPVTVSYRLLDDRIVGFKLGEYDPSYTLVIDPTLLYSSFFGGSAGTYINRVQIDPAGNIWIAGYTSAIDLPVQNAYQESSGGSEDGYLAELNPSGTVVLYLTYIGGSGKDAIQGLSLDNSGNIYLSGGTKSDNFPLQSPIIDTRHESTTGFITKLNPSNPPGSQLVYSTYFGAPGEGYASSSYTGVNRIVADSSGGAWIAGYTRNSTLPVTADAAQPIFGGTYDAYLGHVASDGTLSYLTYLGGSADEGSSSLASAVSGFKPIGLGLDPAGNVYMAGSTKSADFPVLNAYDSTFGGGTDADAFVAKYNATGGKVYATFVGGSLSDAVKDLAVDAAGSVYFTGITYSSDFPVVNPAQGTMTGTRDNFIAKLDSTGTSLDYSTFWGGSENNDGGGWGIAIDDSGNAFVVGESYADDFPIINGTMAGGANNAFVVKLATEGSPVLYSTTIGGISGLSQTVFYSIALNDNGDPVVVGRTSDAGYPVTGDAYQIIKPATWSGVITILTERAPPVADFTADPLEGDAALPVQFTDTSTGDPTEWSWDFGDGGTSDEQNPVHTYFEAGLFTVNLTVTNSDRSDSEEKTDYINVSEPLPIDYGLQYSTFFGSSAYIYGMALDSSKNIYVCGGTTSTDFPVVNAYQSTSGGGSMDGFIAKLSPDGSTILFSTYLGGNAEDRANGIAIDPSGNIYVTGQTKSSDFPTMNALQSSLTGTTDAFVTVLDPTGSSLVYSTYLGGTGITDWGLDIAVDSSGNAYITGYTNSEDFPMSNADQPVYGGSGDAFVTKINPGGSSYVYSTFVGGSGQDASTSYIMRIAVDSDQNAYIAGYTKSSDLPVKNAFQPTLGGGIDGYVSSYNATGSKRYCSYLGGSSTDFATAVAVDDQGAAYITGGTGSSNFPVTLDAYQSTYGSGDDFVSKINPDGSSLEYSTYLGGPSSDAGGYGIAVDPDHNAYVIGKTARTDFPMVDATQPTYGGGLYDVTVSKLNPLGSALLFSTYLGGSVADNPWDIATDSSATIWVAGCTGSSDFPLKNPVQSNSGTAGFVSIFSSITSPVADFTANVTTGTAPIAVRFADNSTNDPTTWSWDFGDGDTSTLQNPSHTYTEAGTYTVNLTVTNAVGSDSEEKVDYITVTEPAPPGSEPLPSNRHIFIEVANDDGVKYDLDGAVYGGPDNTYYIKADGGGLNELHISNDADQAYGQVTTTSEQSGVFYLTNTGGRGFDDDIVILLAVNGTIPDDFSVHIKTSGYNWTPSSVKNEAPTVYSYVEGAVDETFTKDDFIYGPQTWKPGPGTLDVPSLPLYSGQDISDTTNPFQLIFIDLAVGNMLPSKFGVTLENNGASKVEYSFHNLTTFATFNGYGWCLAANQDQGISWTNRMEDPGASGYSVVGVPYVPSPAPVADFTAIPLSGDAPLTVNFTDASTGDPTSWAWDFENDGTIDSSDQHPSFEYSSVGTYTVNLTVTNADGSDSEVKTDYITVNVPQPRTWTVGASGCDFVDLNSAFSNPSMNDGDTIFVNAGIYPLATSLSKAVMLQGEDRDLVTVNPTGVTVSGPGTVVEGLKFSGGTLAFSGADSIIKNCTFKDFSGQHSLGISGQDVTMDRNIFRDNPNRFMIISGSGHVIANNTFTNNGGSATSATRFDGCSNVTVTRNSFTGNPTAPIGLRCSLADNRIYLNDFIDNPSVLFVFTNNPKPQPVAWESQPVTYTYLGTEYTGPLGNYYSSYTGDDADGNGVIDTALTHYASPAQVDNAPLVVPWQTYFSGTGPEAPTAEFTASPESGEVPLAVQFTDTSTGDPTSWSWDFTNDGIIDSTDQNPTHTYMAAGTYSVNLTVTNTAGSDSEVKTDYITIGEPPSGVGLADTAWPKLGGADLNNTGRSPYVGAQTNATKWVYTTGGEFLSAVPVIGSDGTVYIGNYDKNIYAFDPDGSLKWTYTAGNSFCGPPAIGADGTIYIGNYLDYMVYALNPDGTLKWTYNATEIITGGPTIGPDGTIYIGNNEDTLYALNPDGTKKWSYACEGIHSGTPAIGPDGTIYFGADVTLFALNSDGTLKWSYVTGGAGATIYGSPVIGPDGSIYFGSNDKNFYALNPDGTLNWAYTTGGTIRNSPVLGTDGTIYFGNEGDKKIYALNPDGTLKWTYLTGGRIRYASPAIGADGTIYIGSADKNFYALNPDGTLKWFYQTGKEIRASPSIAPDGTVYIASRDGNVYAFDGVVDATADTGSGPSPLSVNFQGTSPLTVTAWNWDFGDGTTSTEQNPSHTYASAGTYGIKLTITHASGTNYLVQAVTVPAPAVSLVADFSATPAGGGAPLTVQFTDASTGDPTSWSWDFDNDGIVDSTEQNPSHTYSSAGIYTVNLTATNEAGSDSEVKTNYISVTAPGAGTWTVGASGCDFTDLNDAFSNPSLNDGDTIFVNAGTYPLSTSLSKSVTLQGAGRDLVTINPSSVTISGPGILFDGFTFTFNGGPITFSGTDNVITHCTFTGFSGQYSVTISGQNTTAADNIFKDNPGRFLKITGDDHLIVNNTFTNSGSSSSMSRIEGSSNLTITRNSFVGNNAAPIGLRSTLGNNKIYLNNFVDNPADVYVYTNNPLPEPITWESQPMTYTYLGTEYTGSLGNYYSSYTGEDADGNGVIDTARTLYTTPAQVDNAPLVDRAAFYFGAEHGIISVSVSPAEATLDVTDTLQLVATAYESDGVPDSGAVFNWSSANETVGTVDSAGLFMAIAPGTTDITAVTGGISGVATISILTPTVEVDFTGSPLQSEAPLTVQFTENSVGPGISAWAWDFENDGIIDDTTQNPAHTYPSVGNYSVNLTVTGLGGTTSLLKEDYVTVYDRQAVAAWGSTTNIIGSDIKAIGAGYKTAFGIREDGSLVQWGNAMVLPEGNDFVEVHGSESRAGAALRENGTVVSFGDKYIVPPVQNDFVTIDVGEDFGVGVRADGSLATWGESNTYGQLDAPSGNDFIAVSAGNEHALALKSDGSIVAWGSNAYGKCDVPEGNDFIAIAAGYRHSLALRANHTVVGWGYSSYGGRSPEGLFTAIEAGHYDSFAIRPDGSLYSWGRGDLNNIPAGNDYIDIAAGRSLAIALRDLIPGSNALAADFTAGPASGAVPLTVHFVDHSAGQPLATSWAWDFNNDGTVDSTSQCAEYTYTLPGTYTVAFTVENNETSSSLTKQITAFSRPVVTASPEGGTYSTPPSVTLSATDEFDTVNAIYYTLDGTDPETSGTRVLYTAPFSIDASTTLRYAAVNTGGHWSLTGITNFVIPGPLHLADTAKPKYQHDNNNTGRSPYTGPQTAALLWNYTTGDGVYSSPVIGADGTVYVGSWDNNVYAINPNGTLKWSFPTGKAVWGTPALDSNGTIYVGSKDKNFYAINPDGTLKWVYPTAGTIIGSAAIGADGTIFIGEHGNNLFCFYPDGTLKWTYSDIYLMHSSPAIGPDGTVYIGAEDNSNGIDNNLYAINPDGTLKWKYDSGSRIRSSPSIGPDGTIYAGNYVNIFALNPDGTLKWEYQPGNWIDTSSAAIGSDGTVYIGSGDKYLYAFNPDGSLKWRFLTEMTVGSSPAIGADGTIYFGSEDFNVYALNPDGTLKWNYLTGQRVFSSPAIAPDGTLYVGSCDNNLYAFRDPAVTPVANFTAIPDSGEVPLDVQFTDTSTGSPTSWAWDFGDGNTSAEQNPQYTYSVAGIYTVNLTVTNAMGSDSEQKTDYITVSEPSGPSPLPDYNNIFVRVANDAGVKYNAFGNHTYNIRFEGVNRGLNALHVSTNPAENFGQVTVTDEQTGTFYATDSGGKGYEDEIILLVAVNGTIPDDFTLHITSDGYTWTPNPVSNQAPSLDDVVYQAVALDETFTKDDFIYGPQIWKPTGNEVDYPLYAGQDLTDPENTFHLMFVDLNAGVLRPNTDLENQGAVRINYTFENLDTFTAFSVYGYCQNSNNGDNMVAWTNALTPDKVMSGYSVFASTAPDHVSVSPASVKLLTGDGRQFTATAYDDEGEEIPGAVFTWTSSDEAVGTVNEAGYFTALALGTTTVNATTDDVSGTAQVTVRVENNPTGGIIPAPDDVYLKVSNALGAYFNDFDDDTFHVIWTGGGLKSLHIDDGEGPASGEVTITDNQSGTFYVTTTGGRGYQDDIFLCVAVNGTIPEDFRIHLMTDGYVWTPNPTPHQAPNPEDTVYNPAALDEWFTKDDLIYGPQTWRPAAGIQYPIFPNQDVADGSNTFMMMFVDMNAGVLTDHPLRIRYEIENLDGMCAFNAYGYAQNANSVNDCVTSWTNRLTENEQAFNGWYVTSALPNPPVVNFVGDNRTGPPPLIVHFTDQSMNSPTFWSWDFQNDGIVDSTEQNPTHTYTAPGTYQVNLTASNAGGSAFRLKGNYIKVTQEGDTNPVVDFTADSRTGTAPFTVQFTDLTVTDPTAWAWDFENDGVIDSTLQNPSYIYTTAGTYQVNLTATNTTGTASRLKANFITVSEPSGPFVATVTVSPDSVSLAAGESQQFTATAYNNGSVVIPDAVFTWSSSNEIVGTVNGTGYFTALAQGATTISAESGGISDTADVEVSDTSHIHASFTTDTSTGRAPCVVRFTDTSTGEGITGYEWDFGDGSTSTRENPTHIYVSAGEYTVTLKVSSESGTDTATGTIVVTGGSIGPGSKVSARFTASPSAGRAPLEVQFTDRSSGAETWSWDFGDGSSTTEQNPAHVFTSAGTYTVTLSISGDEGSSTTTGTVMVIGGSTGQGSSVKAQFTASPIAGRAPLEVQFTDRSTGAEAWSWDFGDGSSTTEQNPVHVYTSAGTYTVTLSISGDEGSSTTTGTVMVIGGSTGQGSSVKAQFTASPIAGRAPLEVRFTDRSTGAEAWSWDFGDGSSTTEQNPVHVYTSAGTYKVTLSVSGADGSDTASVTVMVIKGSTIPGGNVKAQFTASPIAGRAPLEVQFTDQTSWATNWSWDFGDGTNSTDTNPVHVFNEKGTYHVTLVAIVGNTNETATKTIWVI
jgi:PKD repeat protein